MEGGWLDAQSSDKTSPQLELELAGLYQGRQQNCCYSNATF